MTAAIVESVSYLLMIAACLFGAAGTLDWPMAWGVVGSFGVIVLAAFCALDRDLIRVRAGRERGMTGWDPPLATGGFLFLFPALFVVAGLDARRYQWSPPIPGGVTVAAAAAFVFGQAFAFWAVRSNPFFAKFVRIQHERGHHVVRSGPYAYVRHPGYAGSLLAHLMLPLILGSLWALVPAVIGTALFVVRTWLEDRTLQAELPGYRDYAHDVRWRLVPGVW